MRDIAEPLEEFLVAGVRVWVPSVEEEDARRLHRELERLKRDRLRRVAGRVVLNRGSRGSALSGELVDSDNANAVIRRAGQPLVVGPKFTTTGGNGRRQVQGIGSLQAMAGAQLGG